METKQELIDAIVAIQDDILKIQELPPHHATTEARKSILRTAGVPKLKFIYQTKVDQLYDIIAKTLASS
jgi:hypothetical protein